MKISKTDSTNFSRLTENAERYIADKAWAMAAHGNAIDAVKTMRLYRYFRKQKKYLVDVDGYNGQQTRDIVTYKISDIERDYYRPIIWKEIQKSEEVPPLKSVLNVLVSLHKKMARKDLFVSPLNPQEQALIEGFERSENSRYEATGLFDVIKKLYK